MSAEEIEKELEEAGIGPFCTIAELEKVTKKSRRSLMRAADNLNHASPKLVVFQERKGGAITVSRRCAAEYLAGIQTGSSTRGAV